MRSRKRDQRYSITVVVFKDILTVMVNLRDRYLFFTSYGLTWSARRGPVSMLHLIVRLDFVFGLELM